MYPRTPISIETMESETQREQMKEGMRMRATMTITRAVARMHWMV